MFKNLKKWLKNIQDSDELVKKRWLIVFSALSMILVIGLWLIYMNWAINSFGNEIQKQDSGIGFWQVFKTGLNLFIRSVWEVIKNFSLKISGERVIIIE